MDVFTVSLFGHRDVYDLVELEKQLLPIIDGLIRGKEYVSFLIGRNGEFDEFAASIIKRVRRNFGKEQSDVTLVLPYGVARIGFYEKYYDAIIIPESVFGAHPKAAIELRNRWMIERSDLVIVNVDHSFGGAYEAMKYAYKLGKTVERIKAR